MNNALLYIAGFLVCVLAALFAVPHFVDWNSYRGVFEEEASRVLGRDVRIGGTVNLRLLPAPYISLEKLKIADPSSVTGDSLFRAESFTLWLSVPPLLKGVLEANKIEVRRPIIQLVASPEGGGNWQSLSINAGQMPLIPKGVTLQSVTITDGALVMGTTARPEIARLEAINGELAAEALTGPYKFSGTLDAGGAKREVRLATSETGPGNDLRFKVTTHTIQSGDTFTVTGRVGDLKGRAQVEGDLTAVLNVTLFGPPGAAPGTVPASDVTAKVTGDAAGFEFKDITIALQQSATPQLVTGSAKFSWPERTQIEVALASKWLDFDQMSGGGKAIPLDIARRLFDGLAASLPNEADTRTTIALDQVTLGGDAVSDVKFAASRAGGALELKDVRANLPGGARVELDGQLTGADAARAFAGSIALHGQSLQRFASWGTGRSDMINARADGPFALEGALSLSHADIRVTEATAEIAGIPLSGELNATFEGRRKISLVVEGDRLDAGAIWPGSLNSDYALGLLKSPAVSNTQAAASETDPSSAPAAAAGPQDADIRVRLRASELVDGDRLLKNVDADLAIENGALAMPKLNFTTADGLSVELEGETSSHQAENAAGVTGQVRGSVSAPDGAALAGLGGFLELVGQGQQSPQQLAALAPLRVAGSINFGTRTPQAADVQFDGIAGSARITGNMQLDGGWSVWRTSPGQIYLLAESGNIGRTSAALLGGDAKLAALDFDPPVAGRLQIKALAGPGGGFLSNAVLQSDGLEAGFDGTLNFDAQEGWRSAGDVRVKAADARLALALAGVRVGRGAGQVPLSGVVKQASGKGTRTFVMDGLQAGSSKVSGRVSLIADAATGQSNTIDADLAVDSASVPALLAMLSNETVAAPAEPAPAVEEKLMPADKKRFTRQNQLEVPSPVEVPASVWPAQSFDTALFSNLNGTVKATFGQLSVEPGLGISDAQLDAVLTPAQIKVTRLEGKALGGVTSAALTFDKDPAGMKLAGTFALTAAGPAKPFATLKIDASGRASSVAGLISDLKGKGELALAEGAININAPGSLTAAADAALQGKGPVGGEELEAVVRAALKDSSQPLGTVTVPLTVGDGVVRFGNVKVDTPLGRSQVNAVVELDTLKIDSEWQIEPKVQRVGGTGERMLLAPVLIVYTGKLKDLATLEPVIGMAGLERELSVRKMERDVEELERLRKLDQAQAKAEQERRKALEAERAAAAAAAKAARDAAAAGLPPPVAPAPVPPGAQPQTLDQGVAPAAGAPAVTAQTDGSDATAAVPAPEAAAERPVVRKKRPQGPSNWQPFQVTPYQ